jgi:hypothetical protein
MIVHVDLEGKPHAYLKVQVTIDGKPEMIPQMMIIGATYGREDGTSGYIESSSSREIMRWIVDELNGTYDGRRYKTVIQSFHFNWDSSILARDFDPIGMELVHKAHAKQTGQICGTEHPHADGKRCEKYRRFDPVHIEGIISEGGEGDVIAWDHKSELAFAMTPKRRFYVEHRPEGDRYERWRRADIHDVGHAFTGGLEKVIDSLKPELTTAQRAIIAEGKEARSTGFQGWTTRKTLAYSEAECVAAARCTRILLDTVRDATGVDIKPSHLFGSGSIAAEVFGVHHVLKRKDTEPEPFIDSIARLTYFGGHIDAPVVGYITGLLSQEDICSAYPSAMIELPCMREGHGHWQRHKGSYDFGGEDVLLALMGQKTPVVGHVLVSWDWTEHSTSTPPFTVRDKMFTVRAPQTGYRVWVSLPQYRAAAAYDLDALDCHEAVWWVQECDCEKPFRWMEPLYQKRLTIKTEMKSHDPGTDDYHRLDLLQNAIKLVLNSCYGKLAQTRPEPGPYTNLHYASYITGRTRAKVAAEAWRIEESGGIVAYQHTDSELFSGGTVLPDSKKLGDFGVEKPSADQITVQSGLSFSLSAETDEKGNPTTGKSATRGCDPLKFYAAVREWVKTADMIRHPGEWPEIVVNQQRMISRRQALAWGKPDVAGCFIPNKYRFRVAGVKRDFDQAHPMPGQPEAWIIPPLLVVPQDCVATVDDLKEYDSLLNRLTKEGAFDE